jgi:hypothetical protein
MSTPLDVHSTCTFALRGAHWHWWLADFLSAIIARDDFLRPSQILASK